MLEVLLLGVAIATGTSEPIEASLTRLRTAEIKVFLAGSTIERGHRSDGLPYAGSAEQFGPGGAYARLDDRNQVDGTYRIADDEVFVQIPKREPICRQVFLDAKGNPWLREPRSKTENRFGRYSKVG